MAAVALVPAEPPGLPLDAVQGDWVASRGEVVEVAGAELRINGKLMPGGLKLTADGQTVVGFGVYKLIPPGDEDDGRIRWQVGYQEIIWRRAAEGEVVARKERNSAQMLHGAAVCGGQAFEAMSEQDAIARMNALIARWREGPCIRVRSCDVCPDWTNRAETGLSVDHVHYVASLISMHGFKSRRRGLGTEDGAHDVPILVRETGDTRLGSGALAKWREATAAGVGFPPFLLGGKEKSFYCSLGNGHFSQALNLFRTGAPNLWTDLPYTIGGDDALREALDEGVDSVVLSRDMPTSDRKFVSEMLNKSHGHQWIVSDDGHVSVKETGAAEGASQFEALSKVLDAEELSCLVRQKLGVDVDGKPVDGGTSFAAAPTEWHVVDTSSKEDSSTGSPAMRSRL